MGVPKLASEKRGELTARAMRINLVNLGTAQILTIPGEALPNINFYLKRKMHGTQNLLFGLTNDAFGYILTKVDFHITSARKFRILAHTNPTRQRGL